MDYGWQSILCGLSELFLIYIYKPKRINISSGQSHDLNNLKFVSCPLNANIE